MLSIIRRDEPRGGASEQARVPIVWESRSHPTRRFHAPILGRVPRIRPFRSGDEPDLARICLLTADAGGDATGVLEDDDLWARIFVLPYVARHPEFAFVVETDDGR